MYCLFCGKAVPDNSAFCMYCGKELTGASSPAVPPSTPPTYIRWTAGWPDGPTVNKRPASGGWFKKKHRGFAVAIILADEAGNQTTADGVFRLEIRIPAPNLFGGRKLKKEISVSKDDFALHEFRYGIVTHDWAFIYRDHEPVLYDQYGLLNDSFDRYYYEVWFNPTNGQDLHAEGEIPWR